MNTRPTATAKVRYQERDGNVELSVTHQEESPIEFMRWLVKAVAFYRARLQFDHEYAYVASFVIDYRLGNEHGTVFVSRDETNDYVGATTYSA